MNNNFQKQIVSITRCVYIPSFDESSGEYIDISPYKPYSRNHIQYECRCRAGCIITNTTTFKQHVKSKTHKDFIQNYKKYYAELDQAKETIKELRVENEFLTRKNIKLQKQIYELENEEFHDVE
jgi:hypothetical protein